MDVRGVQLWNVHHALGDAHRTRPVARGRSVQLQCRDERVPRDPLTRPSIAPPLFTVELTGSGRASASFIGLADEASPAGRSFPSVPICGTNFVQPQPVPEPGTLFLVGGAIAALAARRSLRSRRRQRVERLTQSADTRRKHWSKSLFLAAHNPKVAGSKSRPATNKNGPETPIHGPFSCVRPQSELRQKSTRSATVCRNGWHNGRQWRHPRRGIHAGDCHTVVAPSR